MLAAIVFSAAYWLAHKSVTPTAATASPSPSPSRVVTTAKGTCALLIPTGQRVADQILALAAHPDGSTMDWSVVEKSVDDLTTIKDMSDSTWSTDIDAQIEPLQQLLEVHSGGPNRTLNLEGLRASGLRIAGRCAGI